MRKSPLLIAASALVVGCATVAAPLLRGRGTRRPGHRGQYGDQRLRRALRQQRPARPPPAPPSPPPVARSSRATTRSASPWCAGPPPPAAAISRSTAVSGVARNRVIGVAPKDAAPQGQRGRAADQRAGGGQGRRREGRTAGTHRSAAAAAAIAPEPLADSQWDMRQIGATPTGSYAVQPGSQGVLVGVIDTGIDGTHPDIAPNFDAADSHNFVTDLPGHRRAVRGAPAASTRPTSTTTVTAPTSPARSPRRSTGIGIAGVAPNVPPGQPAGRSGLGLLLPGAHAQRDHCRR